MTVLGISACQLDSEGLASLETGHFAGALQVSLPASEPKHTRCSTSEVPASEVFAENPKEGLKREWAGFSLQIILCTTNVPNFKFISLCTRNVSFWSLTESKF